MSADVTPTDCRHTAWRSEGTTADMLTPAPNTGARWRLGAVLSPRATRAIGNIATIEPAGEPWQTRISRSLWGGGKRSLWRGLSERSRPRQLGCDRPPGA